MNVYVREMTADDFDQVRSLYISGWQNAFKGIVPQDYLDNMNLDEWAPPLDGAYVLTDGKNILGTSSVSPARDASFDGWGEIISVYVLPELVGHGYGHILFEAVKEKLLERGYDQIYLTVFEDNMRARIFYEKHHFSWNQERIPVNVGGRDLIELRYVFRQDCIETR
ncbi:MAG: GNAT family N-acetyltransferase [Lachnospiraceae bacterium]|nr:GNAT family N-acetyltransferase [Lachnospiraceae bacterium]